MFYCIVASVFAEKMTDEVANDGVNESVRANHNADSSSDAVLELCFFLISFWQNTL